MSFFRRLTFSQQGQSSIMVGIMMLTFLFLFCFVVNVGMLVNAKINLQNAADLAAYAGAAVQARQMDAISYLNYEMRRQYKKFLFRYYVIGNMAEKQFPRQSSPGAGHTPHAWSPDSLAPQNVNFGVPVVCIIFKPTDNYCQLNQLPPIQAPPPSPFDAINNTLIDALHGFEQIRQRNCQSINITNWMALLLWLYNTDPHLDLLKRQASSLGNNTTNPQAVTDVTEALGILTEIADGLGLIPRELLLRSRIKTLEGYLNDGAHASVNLDTITGLKASQDPARYERTIQAFLSAYYTLGNHIFSDNIQFDELLPNGANNIFKLKDISARFDSYAIHFTNPADNSPPNNNGGGTVAQACQSQVYNESLMAPIVVGVTKDPAILTYYAVRLKAQAKLLFSPWGEIELTAYSAARPFGSRIGPALEDGDFLRKGATANVGNASNTASIDLAHAVPNLPVSAVDDTTTSGGWNTEEVLGTFYRAAFPSSGGVLTTSDLHRAYQIVMGPNPYEGPLYNVPNDNGDSRDFGQNFDGSKLMSVWAPIFPPDQAGSVDSELQTALEDMISAKTPQAQQLKATLKQGIVQYINQLRGGPGGAQGQNGETFNVIQLQDPSFVRPDQLGQPTLSLKSIGLPEWALMQNPADFLTSWNHPNDAIARITYLGQTGYSVKFVAFNTLLAGATTTEPKNGTTMINGIKGVDPEADAEIESLPY